MGCKLLGPASEILGETTLPLAPGAVRAGFPSPAADYLENTVCLQELLIAHPQATFLMRVEGDSMVGAGIHDGDIVVVDRAIKPGDGKVVVAVMDGDFAIKRLRYRGGECFLESANPKFKPIPVTEHSENSVWGVVTNVIHRL